MITLILQEKEKEKKTKPTNSNKSEEWSRARGRSLLTWGSANPVTCRLVASITREMTWEGRWGWGCGCGCKRERREICQKREGIGPRGKKKKKEKKDLKKSTVGTVLRAGTRVLELNWSIGSDSIQFTANQIQ